ncbi:MFS transporter [Alkalihalobacillus sp. LMS39]|uniref:MFS transporter n=1 Tax=Alkalihalobacillus sp. LMS39 TaxID=2924032 RepID=UPI001FB4B886|nr:MFS transporter [Alkalihalobacillus sp. LMS39]UOE95500.1 MFS transporter [Alkalihalobacillus sp. LMS39]
MKQSLWKQADFLKMWGSQSFQSLGHILLLVLIMTQIYAMTESVFGAAAVLALMSGASFISGLLASYFINQFSLTRLLYYIGWVRGISTVILGYLLLAEGQSALFLILIVLFFSSFVGAWYQPARFALLPLVVSKSQYMKANGTITLVHQLLITAGWGIGGLMAVFAPFPVIIGITASCFILSGILIKSIRLTIDTKSVKVDSKVEHAWKKIFRIPTIRTITLMDFIEGLANAIWASALLLAFTTVVLEKGSEWWGALNAGYTVGAMIGSLLVISGLKLLERRIGLMIGLCGLSMGIFTFLFALSPYAILAVIVCVLMGPMYSIRDICQETVLQDIMNHSERASVMAARNAIIAPWTGCTFLIMGYLADVLGVQMVYYLAATLYCIASVIALLHPSLREYTYKVEQELRA